MAYMNKYNIIHESQHSFQTAFVKLMANGWQALIKVIQLDQCLST